jgi:hypothetical protein|uniref:Ribosomal protein S2 n=1 Tax=Diphylleia rotans TaxID=190327 RepID=A0A146I6C9_9EUKA|nr:ribosomal protein S2 [Diphylleia rotans]BAU71435.1 ribosomal protein S2 [Diphylleia rotans]
MFNVLLKTKLRVNSAPTQYWKSESGSSIQKYIFGRRIEGDKKTAFHLSGGPSMKGAHRGSKKSRLTGRSGPLLVYNYIYTLVYLRKALYLIRHLTGSTVSDRNQVGRFNNTVNHSRNVVINNRIVFVSTGLEPKLSSIVKLAAIRAGCRLIDRGGPESISGGTERSPISLLIVFSPNKNEMIIKEAKKKKIPVIAFINSGDKDITIPIPANVERSGTLSLMANLLADAVIGE